jgi:flagellar motor switch protein FliG
VLAHLPAEKAAELLNRLDQHRKVEVVKRIASIEHTRAEVIEQVELSLRERLRAVMGRTIRSAGVSAVAEILNSTAREVEAEILSDLEAEAPDLADQVRRVQGIMDDLLGASDDDIRAVIEQVDDVTISLALRTAGDRLRQKVLWNLPAEQAEAIEREMNDLSPVPVRDIEAAQQRVAEVVHRLEAAGEIDLVTPAAQSSLPVGAKGRANAQRV